MKLNLIKKKRLVTCSQGIYQLIQKMNANAKRFPVFFNQILDLEVKS